MRKSFWIFLLNLWLLLVVEYANAQGLESSNSTFLVCFDGYSCLIVIGSAKRFRAKQFLPLNSVDLFEKIVGKLTILAYFFLAFLGVSYEISSLFDIWKLFIVPTLLGSSFWLFFTLECWLICFYLSERLPGISFVLIWTRLRRFSVWIFTSSTRQLMTVH